MSDFLRQLSTEDLQAIKAGNIQNISTEGLQLLKSRSELNTTKGQIKDTAKAVGTGLAFGAKRGLKSLASLLQDIGAAGTQKISDITGLGADDAAREQEKSQQLKTELESEKRQFENLDIVKRNPIASEIGKTTGEVGSSLIAGGPIGRLAGGIAKGSKFISGVIGDMTAGAVVSGTLAEGSLEERSKEAATGALLTGGIGAALRAPGALAKKGFKSLRSEAETKQLETAAKEAGVDLSVGQATARRGIQKIENSLGELPVIGTRGKFKKTAQAIHNRMKFFVQQNNKVENISVKIVDDLDKGMSQIRQVSDDLYTEFLKQAKSVNKPVNMNLTDRVIGYF